MPTLYDDTYNFENPASVDPNTLELNKVWMLQSGIDFLEDSINNYGETLKQFATDKGYSIEMRIPHGKFLFVRFTEGNGNPTQNCFYRGNLP